MGLFNRSNRNPLTGKTAILSGASKGIGKATAAEFASRGASVALIARHEGPLQETAEEIRASAQGPDQFVETIAVDATDSQALGPALTDFIDRHGVPDYLINLVGYAYPDYLPELSLQEFRDSMESNYFGQLIPTLMLLPHFMSARKGHIANVSSVMGFMGIMGYGAYAPAKHAIVGLSRVLRNELKPYGIRVSILYPPDTDTPGFAVENETKPEETRLMSESVQLMTAEQVAGSFVESLLKNRYHILPGDTGLVWRMHRWFPWLVRWFSDREYRKASERLGKA